MDFEALAKQLNMAEEDRSTFLAVTAKYPLGNVVTLKSDFDRAQAAFENADSFVKKWEDFRTRDWDEEHGMTKQQWQAEQEVATLRGKVASMEAGTYVPTGDPMDFAELEKELIAKGYLKKDDVTGLVKSAKDEVVSTVDGKLNQQSLNQEFFFTRAASIPLKYMKEFGSDDFDMDGFMKFVVSNGVRYLVDPSDPTGKTPVKNFTAAYNDFVAPKRSEVKAAELAAKEAELKTREEAVNAKTTSAASPTDDGRGASVPPFQRKIQGLDATDAPPDLAGDAPLGSGVLGARMMEMYRRGELKIPGKAN
jgi:hypothetical protein